MQVVIRVQSVAIRELSYCTGVDGGDTRLFVAYSKAKASSMSRGSLHAVPVKLTPNGAGLALNLRKRHSWEHSEPSWERTITVDIRALLRWRPLSCREKVRRPDGVL